MEPQLRSLAGSFVERLKERLGELGARRLRLGRHQYWDLKPDAKPGETVVL